MTKASATSPVVDKPPVYKHARTKSLGRIASDTAMQDSLAVANLCAERNIQKAAVLRPIIDLVRRDPAATEAASQVIRIQKQISDLLSGQPPLGLGTPPINVGPSDMLFFPPYAHIYVGSHGLFDPSMDNFAQGADGTFKVDAPTSSDNDGVFKAVVGFGLDLATSKPGSLELRPLVHVIPWWFVHIDTVSAYVESRVTLTVLDSTTQRYLTNRPASFTIFSHGNDDLPQRDDLFVTGDRLSVTVNVEAQRP